MVNGIGVAALPCQNARTSSQGLFAGEFRAVKLPGLQTQPNEPLQVGICLSIG